MNRLSKWRIGLYLAAIFVAGTVTGVVLTCTVGWRLMSAAFSEQKMAEHWCAELQSKLNLNPDQMQRIRPIVNDTIHEVRTNLTERLSTMISNCNARIEHELTPEQKVKFEELVREHETRMRQRFEEPTNSVPPQIPARSP